MGDVMAIRNPEDDETRAKRNNTVVVGGGGGGSGSGSGSGSGRQGPAQKTSITRQA